MTVFLQDALLTCSPVTDMNFHPPAAMALPRPTPKELALRTLQANQEHQFALAQYATNLDSELAELDKLLVCTTPTPSVQPFNFPSGPGRHRRRRV